MRSRLYNRIGIGAAAVAGLALGGCALDSPAQRETSVAGAADATSVATRFPTPTLVPTLPAQSPQIELLPPDAMPSPTAEPTPIPIQPTAPPAAPPAAIAPTTAPATPQPVVPSPARNGIVTIELEDTDWSGGFRNESGYRGRSATWIYGTSTQYDTMQAAFTLETQPGGEATLSIEGMDSEGRQKTPISITVNGYEIYNGPNRLPDDEYPFQVGTWATATWRFDASFLRQGQNTVTIRNLATGAYSLPPFLMLDYAILTVPTS